MDLVGTTEITAAPARVYAEVCDLATYPSWLGIVYLAEPADADGEPGPAWTVDLGARLGPLTQKKRVRMVRTAHDPPARVRFERRERDGNDHSAWVLAAEVGPGRSGSVLTMRLHYGGLPSIPMVERLLHDEIRKAGERLEERIGGTAG